MNSTTNPVALSLAKGMMASGGLVSSNNKNTSLDDQMNAMFDEGGVVGTISDATAAFSASAQEEAAMFGENLSAAMTPEVNEPLTAEQAAAEADPTTSPDTSQFSQANPITFAIMSALLSMLGIPPLMSLAKGLHMMGYFGEEEAEPEATEEDEEAIGEMTGFGAIGNISQAISQAQADVAAEEAAAAEADAEAQADVDAAAAAAAAMSNPEDEEAMDPGEGDGDGSAGDDPGGGGPCWVAGTQILMEDGSCKNIENLKIGDMVMSFPENSKIRRWNTSLEAKPIIDLLVSKADIWHLNDSMVSENEWMVKSDGTASLVQWLNVGDELMDQDGNKVKVYRNEPAEGKLSRQVVYNFESENNYSYIANNMRTLKGKAVRMAESKMNSFGEGYFSDESNNMKQGWSMQDEYKRKFGN